MATLDELLAQARNTQMTPEQREAQRQSFAYGNSHFENPHITRATVQRESEKLRKEAGGESS
ncbi:MAG TPA: hypothetical protein VL175_18295 [Pirellulales bacterium]|jgi:hypothetical protein|nr:hypothetical protein [Pirellulales bacterium]